jgi:hypothetical protein
MSPLAENRPDRWQETADAGPPFRVPPIARAVIRLIRIVPTLVTVAFGGWAVAAALAGEGAIAAAAAMMSLLALSVAVRSAMSGDRR